MEVNNHSTTVIRYFKTLFPLNKEEIDILRSLLNKRELKRKAYLLYPGEICRHFSFIVSGCLRQYAVDEGGKEHNIRFVIENDWICDFASFYSESPSKTFIEALEPTTIMQIQHEDLLHLYINYHKFDRNFRIIIERHFIELQTRMLNSISMNAEMAYVAFSKQYPELSKRIPAVHIASYLGVTPEFLSQVRKKLLHKS